MMGMTADLPVLDDPLMTHHTRMEFNDPRFASAFWPQDELANLKMH
ncbi:hypothetical protein NKJ84_28115 [Mesorhizobium sp. M0048]